MGKQRDLLTHGKTREKETFRTSIGGQALIEGILMRGPEKQAIVVRAPEGLVTKVEELKLVRDKYPILGLPIIRGVVTFLDSMVKGIKALMFSADYFPMTRPPSPPNSTCGWKSMSRRRSSRAYWSHFPCCCPWHCAWVCSCCCPRFWRVAVPCAERFGT